MKYEIRNDARHLDEVIRKVARQDVYDFMLERKKPVATRESTVVYVDDIQSRAKITPLGHAEVRTSGKQTKFPDCLLDVNLDFADWCLSNITPDGKLDADGACEYCYAGNWHNQYPFIREVNKIELTRRFREARDIRAKEDLPTRYVRLGKMTDAGPDIFLDHLRITFEVLLDLGLKAIMPTKHLGFYPDIAAHLRATNSTLLYSLGSDEIEKGRTALGRTQDWRMKQARMYLDVGVRAVPYVLIDPTREDGGYFAPILKKALGFPKVLLLPVRITRRDLAETVLGGWGNALGPASVDLFGNGCGGFELDKTTLVHGNELHPNIEKLVAESGGRVGLCSHNISKFWCNGCFMPGHEQIVKIRGRKLD
ncbi:hypothetical protein HYU23_00875 [Candidatus Woesearchaeota archaeon]|nr:hypothetical protein [Candidatus Woesearchaeota archaeon]